MSRPTLGFVVSHVADNSIAVYVQLNGETLGHSALDLSIEEWHALEQLDTGLEFVAVETKVER